VTFFVDNGFPLSYENPPAVSAGSWNARGKEGIFLEVKVIDNDVEKALKILKNKLSKNGLFKELKLRRAYEKPSVKRKRKALEARRRMAKARKRRRF